MIQGAWRTGEPGCFFIDEANRYNPVPHLGSLRGDEPVRRAAAAAVRRVQPGQHQRRLSTSRDGKLDWDAFRRDIHLSTHFLDNVIDVNRYPLAEIETLSKRIRRIGLGVMGFADALVRLGIAYDSPEGVEFGRKVMAFVDTESKRESERLAHERGAFPEWARSIWGPDDTCARDAAGQRIRPMQLLRNCNVTTVAPTGTISIIAGCSSGLEPLFAVAFMRNQAGVMMPDVNEDFVAVAKREGWYSEQLMERIAKEGRIDFPEVPVKWQRVFVTANAIKPEWHMRMQAAFQEHCDSAISKTTNFAHTATVADVRAIYELAYELKCKGVTVYRDGSRDNQVLSTGATEKAKAERDKGGAAATAAPAADKREIGELMGTLAERDAEIDRLKKALFEAEAENLQRRAKRSRPDKLRGTTARYETPLGTMFANITEDDRGQPFEVFINLGKAGGSAMADAEAMGRLISLALRSGIPLHGDPPSAPRDRVGSRRRTRPEEDPISARRDRHGARGLVARPHPRRTAGPAERRGHEVRLAPARSTSRCRGCSANCRGRRWSQRCGGAAGHARPLRRRDRVVHRHLPRLRITAGVRGGVREVSCVRIFGVWLRGNGGVRDLGSGNNNRDDRGGVDRARARPIEAAAQ